MGKRICQKVPKAKMVSKFDVCGAAMVTVFRLLLFLLWFLRAIQ